MTNRKNRLRPDAIPSLFLDNDIIDARNIPSTSSAVSSGIIRVNKPSPIKNIIDARNIPSTSSAVSSGIIRVNKPSPIKNIIDARNIPSTSSAVSSGIIRVNKPSPIKNIIDARNIPSTSSAVSSGIIRVNKPSPIKNVIDARNIPSTSSAVSSGIIRVNKPSPIKNVIDARNIPSTSSAVNNGFIGTNKPSCSSTNYVANINSKETPLFVYIESVTRSAKDLTGECSVPGCITNIVEDVEDISLFAPPIELVDRWSSILGLDLTINSIVCERHFKPQDILRPKLLVNDVNSQVKVLAPVSMPVPVMNAVPESRTYCSIPGCTINNVENVGDISLFTPPIELVDRWSSILGLDLTINSIVCERHFKPQDILCPKLLVNDVNSQVKVLAPFSMPIPAMDPVPESRTYCCIPGCTTNTVEEVEDISFFTPQNEEDVIEWNLSVCVELTKDSAVCEKHFRPEDIVHSNLLTNGINSKGKSLAPFAVPVTIISLEPQTVTQNCSLPGCVTNNMTERTEDICLFAPTIEQVEKWSSVLDFQLTEDSKVCERHFRPHDMLQPMVMYDGVYQKVKSLVTGSLPLPRNTELSASNATPFIQQLETNDVPVLRTCDVKFKRHKPDELLCTKTIKNNVLDKSLSTTSKMFSSKNANKEFTAVTNETHEYNTTPDLDPTLKSNTANSVDFSVVKIEPLVVDNLQTNLETEPEQLLPDLGTKLVEDDNILPLSSIDDSLSISLTKLKNISANSSLSVTLEPIANSKMTEPSVDLYSKVSPKSSMSITLLPKHNLPSTTNNSSPSVSLTPCLPSTSSSSVYNTSQQSLSQYKQKETSAFKMPVKLSSNTVEIKMPVISKCVSLAVHSDTDDSNPYIILDDDDDDDDDDTETEDFIEKDYGFIYEISKTIVLPTLHWKIKHDRSRNSTVFYEEDDLYETVKNITFDNSLLPKIQVYGMKYKYNKPVRTKNELQNLLEKIDFVAKCEGVYLSSHKKCIGYYDKITEYVTSCSACQKLLKTTESMTKTAESLEQIISERTARVLELRRNMENMENNKINFSLINSMTVCRR
ncbi:uncharacterized protein LOC100165674 isoform X1 [Acyrthosiphon pisum]|uniref:THAP-type domain-containing protein n=1 Tax=Acyrthosiphon pisum TaxID=7029 RepID=A0A8R2NSU0_ACYPI|nr:uncharacterized protein LOC100165674 isoform X1 [Acyrthosiphon pisum]